MVLGRSFQHCQISGDSILDSVFFEEALCAVKMLVYVCGHQRELPLRCKRLCSTVDRFGPARSVISPFYYIPLAECGQIRASKSPSEVIASIPRISLASVTQRFFLGVQAPAVVPRDNSGTGIPSFPLPLKPASARGAIPRTSSPLQVCNSWAHGSGHIVCPCHYSLLSHRSSSTVPVQYFPLISSPG